MNAETSIKINIKSGPPPRHIMAPSARVLAAVAKTFKKTPSVADSKRGGRDVAKDMVDAGVTPPRKHVRRDDLVVDGAVAYRGGAREKQCHADI